MSGLTKGIFMKLCEVANERYNEEAWSCPRKKLSEYIWEEVDKDIQKEVEKRVEDIRKGSERDKADFERSIKYLQDQLAEARKLNHCQCEFPRDIFDETGRHCGNCGKPTE